MYPVAIYACEIAGLVTVLVNPASTAKELATFMDLSESKVLLSHPSSMAKAVEVVETHTGVALFSFDDADLDDGLSRSSPAHIMTMLADDELATTPIQRP